MRHKHKWQHKKKSSVQNACTRANVRNAISFGICAGICISHS